MSMTLERSETRAQVAQEPRNRFAHAMPFGAEVGEGVRFRFWAPFASSVRLEIAGRSELAPMTSRSGGWFEAWIEDAKPGDRYQFVLPDGRRCADPASRSQPDGPHGLSEVIDPHAYAWRHASWRGLPWHEAVLYELHVGAFTPEGTFRSAIAKLDHLVALGVTAVEVMPIAEFQGDYGWGYDGVLIYAPAHVYGRPEDFKAFVEAAHERGIMVLLDVVYNHMGPEGNSLGFYAPLTTDRHATPWGDAINFDDAQSEEVREFFIQNALYWLNEFRLDGLRLDSINFIDDDSDRHLLVELADRVRALHLNRQTHLIVENPRNGADWMKRERSGRPRYYTAQWSDDIHNTLHCMATGETQGYYADYGQDPVKAARALAEGFCYQGEIVPSSGLANGEGSAYLPPAALVSYIQNHDQIGNRPFGDRIARLADHCALKAIAAINALSPHIPLIFMGEEWGTERPFYYFADFEHELAQSIRDGRRKEFSGLFEKEEAEGVSLPDPISQETFLASKLDWDEREAHGHVEWLAFYRRLLAIRRAEVTPRNGWTAGDESDYEVSDSGAFRVRWRMGDGARLSLVANLSGKAQRCPPLVGREVWNTGITHEGDAAPWAVAFTLQNEVAK